MKKNEVHDLVKLVFLVLMIFAFLFLIFLAVKPIAESFNYEESEDTLERWERQEKQREDLVSKEFGVSSKDFILVDGEDTEYEVLIDGKYYALVFDFDYTKLEKVVFKGFDD